MQTQNDSSDTNKIIPDLYACMQDQLLALCYPHPAKTLMQIVDTAKQSIFPIFLHIVLMQARKFTVKFATQFLISKCSLNQWL